jgi:hypothetical protein
MKKLVIYFVILVASLMLFGCGDKTKEPLALHNKLTTALEKKDFGFIFDSLTIESQKWALDFISDVSKYTPEVAEIAKTKSGRDLFVATCEKGRVISDVFKAEKISKIEVNGDEAIIIVEGDPFPSMMIRENGDWKFKPKFHVLNGMKDESESSGDKQPSISDSSVDSESTSESEAPMTPEDQFELGRRYSNGTGLPKDEVKAQEVADHGDGPFIGEYSIYNQKYADLKISKKLSGEFNLSVKESEKEDWRELAELRPATAEELQQALGDRWDRVQSSLVLQDGLVPKVAFYYIKPGQFGTDLIYTPTCLFFTQESGLKVIDKFSPEKAAAFDAAKENHAKVLLQKIENLKNAEVFAMPPYGDLFTDENKRETQMREKMQDKVVEWTVFVNDITKHEDNYKLTTSTDTSDLKTCRVNSIEPTIVIVSPNAEDRKAIEALASGEKIKVRGHFVVPEDGDISNLILHPAILITDSAISKSEAGCISVLINLTSSEFLSLEKLQRELAVPSLTTLQKNKIINAYEGKIVEGSIFVGTYLHQHAMTGNAFWGMEVKENVDHSLRISELETKQKEIEKLLKDSQINDSKRQMLYDEMETISKELVPLQNLRESDVSESRQINTALDVIMTSQNDMEYNWLKEYKSEGIRKPIQFRGVINSIKFEEIPEIRIWPAILKPHANPLADP